MEELNRKLPQSSQFVHQNPINNNYQNPQQPPRRRRRSNTIDNVDIQISNFVQIRSLLRDLRPSFIEILKTPNFCNSKAAMEISSGMVKMNELCKQLKSETGSSARNKRPFDSATMENVDNQSSKRQKQDIQHEAHGGGLHDRSKNLQKPEPFTEIHGDRFASQKNKNEASQEKFIGDPNNLNPTIKKEDLGKEIPGAGLHGVGTAVKKEDQSATVKKEDSCQQKSAGGSCDQGGKQQKQVASQQKPVIGGSPMGWNFVMFPQPAKDSSSS